MSKLFTGSICIETLSQALKDKHTAFVKGNNGKTYMNIKIWHNDKEDEYGNCISMQLNSRKDAQELEGKIYIGNAKEVKPKDPTPISSNDANALASQFEQFAPPSAETNPAPSQEIAEDLPF